jgi:hypothetical protein
MVVLAAIACLSLVRQREQIKSEATLKEESGFLRATFTSIKGTVTVILPSDIAQGDTISGTYFTDVKAKDLTDIQIDLGKAHGPPGDISNNPRRKWDIPSDAEPRLTLAVWTPDGTSFGTTYVSVATKRPKSTQFNCPSFARIGAPCLIPGPFDGDAENTTAKAAGVDCPVLAESPRGAVMLIPSAMKMGISTIQIKELNTNIEAPTRMLSVSIHSPKASISVGEQSTFSIKIDGLLGVHPDKAPMIVLENLTPKVIDLQGKVKHYLFAKPSEDGTYQSTLSINRLAAGKFAISAIVDPGIGTFITQPQNSNSHRSAI